MIKGKYSVILNDYKMNHIERNIIIGSILGDGSLALYGRSINAHYKEHGGKEQIPYRKWKASMLSNLDFKFYPNSKTGAIKSPSHRIYTELYNKFYINNEKTITEENIKLLDHPIGLACLYLDDGTLVINSSIRNNYTYIYPRINIASQSFTENGNIILRNHIKNTFNITFNLAKIKDGYNYILELNKRNEINKFLNLLKPYVEKIDCMRYKIDIDERLKSKENSLKDKNINVRVSSDVVIDNSYSIENEELIIKLKKQGVKDKEIANSVGRPYWGTVDKIRRLRKEGKL